MDTTPELREALGQATRWRLLGCLLSPPRPDVAPEIEELADGLSAPEGALARTLAAMARTEPDLDAAYHRLLGPGGACPPAESDHDRAASCNKGPLIADVCAFYRAFAFEPGAEMPEAPDHVAVECNFFAYLHFKHAHARFVGHQEASEVTAKALRDFWNDHLGRFLPTLLERLEEATLGHPYYEPAVHLARALSSETGT